MLEKDFNVLLKGYLEESLSSADLKMFIDQAQRPENSLILQQSFEQDLRNDPTDLTSPEQARDAWSVLAGKFEVAQSAIPVRRSRWYWVAASACLLVIFGGIYFFKRDKESSVAHAQTVNPFPAWLKPEHLGATLYLMNGDSVLLDQGQQGKIATQDDIQIFHDAGTISYSGSGSEGQYNELKTGPGSMFRCILPDQTVVWLNSSSFIKYPLRFTSGERLVEINGEAYFEVTHHAGQPFRVKAGEQMLEDMGTSFNVDASEKQKVTTTLIEGSVLVTLGDKQEVLKPGEQTIVSEEKDQIIVDQHPNLEKALAWKNGLFYFQNAGIRSVMNQLGNWYGVEVVYQGVETKELFSGQIDKSIPLVKVLQGFQQPGVQLTLSKDHLTVNFQK